MIVEKATAWRNEPAISTPINPMNLCSPEEKPREVKAVYMGIGGKAVKIFDRNWAKSELKPQLCSCCLAPLPADSNTCEYCGTTYR